MSSLSSFYAFKFVRQLTKDFEEWDAYEMGLIDAQGNTLREPSNEAEKDALNPFLRIVKNIKKQIEKVPGLGSSLGSYASAVYLMKEDEELEAIAKSIKESFDLSDEFIEETGHKFLEETTTTADVPTGASIGPMPDGKAAGMDFFDVDDHVFKRVYQGKKKKKRWKNFLEFDENSENVRQYARKYPSRPVMLRNKSNPTEFQRVR